MTPIKLTAPAGLQRHEPSNRPSWERRRGPSRIPQTTGREHAYEDIATTNINPITTRSGSLQIFLPGTKEEYGDSSIDRRPTDDATCELMGIAHYQAPKYPPIVTVIVYCDEINGQDRMQSYNQIHGC